MVEEHVGKKRRKEVRQAINMNEELRKSLVFIWTVLGIGCVLVLVFTYFSYSRIIPISDTLARSLPLVFLFIAMVIIAPRANKYWTLRDQYKEHRARYNISKDDMNALRNDEL